MPKITISHETEVDHRKILSDGDYNDSYLRSIQNNSGEKYLRNLEKSCSKRLNLIKCDSTQLSFKDEVGPIEFAFIDGGHHRDIISKDTQNVLCQMKSGVIVWHDYSSSIHSDVTSFLLEHSEKNQLFYVSGGLCAFQIMRGTND